MSTAPRPQLASTHPDTNGYGYNCYWFADVRNERAHACSCPDYFHRNIVAGDATHQCRHLRELALNAVRAIHQAVAASGEGDVDAMARSLGIEHPERFGYSAVYRAGKVVPGLRSVVI